MEWLKTFGIAFALAVLTVAYVNAGPGITTGSPGAGSEDKTTLAVTTIDYSHHEVHSGSHFFFTDWTLLASGATTEFVLKTNDSTNWPHLTFSMTGNSITEINVFEDTPFSGVSLVSPINNDRNSGTTPMVTLWKTGKGNPVTGSGTTIFSMRSGSANVQSRAPMTATHSQEIILKQNTKYLFRTRSGAADNLTNIQLEWYEHTNK